jgi:UDP-N-acetylmuramoyl-tripeptide--D-alanyl-D-alanine ligase
MSLAEVAAAVDGRIGDGIDPEDRVTGGVEHDSRKVTPGGLFLALPGERVDGHDYAARAAAAGAAAVLATRPVEAPAIYVEDGLRALAALATEVASRAGAVVVGVTGSNGKTSTKDLIGQLCASLGPTVATQGNFNNELGHPYTVCRVEPGTEYLVLELAARGLGHITELCRVAPPDIGVVLNVGISHLDGFGSIATTAEAKSELPRFLSPDGTAILNADDPRVAAMAEKTAAAVITFGVDAAADVTAADIDPGDGRHAFTLVTPDGTAPVRLQLWGAHHLHNALAAAAAAWRLGATPDHIAEQLSQAGRRSERRMDVFTNGDGVTVIDDSYNANPASMSAAIRTLAQIPTAGRRIAVLGLMADLEEQSEDCHRSLGEQAAEAGIDDLIAVGDGTQPIVDGAKGVAADHEPDQAAAIERLRSRLRTGDTVLVKGSRYRTWDIADFLRAGKEDKDL